ncbi:MAG: hypothetical protein GXP41_03395 [Chloroflexi bacterium]|nr:hypothetical protein [Chloroflexota bacterium]
MTVVARTVGRPAYFDNVTFERLANEFAATWGEAALRQLNEATQVAFATGSTRFQPPCKEM